MSTPKLQSRMLWAALLPIFLLACLLSSVFMLTRVGDFDKAFQAKNQALVQQLVVASEYGLFSGNTTQLRRVAKNALSEQDLASVMVFDIQGVELVSLGQRRYKTPLVLGQQSEIIQGLVGHTTLYISPVFSNSVDLEDTATVAQSGAPMAAQLLGHLVVEFSRDSFLAREQDILIFGFSLSLFVLVLCALLATRLVQGVIEPVLGLSRWVERLGRGDYSARIDAPENDALRELKLVLNQMAERLESSRDDLEERILLATNALREKKEEAESATLAKTRFLSAASHDLRQPTHAMGMFVARLQQLPHEMQSRRVIDGLEKSVLAMQGLLDGLLDISRLDALAVTPQFSHFCVNEVLDHLQLVFEPSALEKGLRLRVRSSPIWVRSDPALLYQMLSNLLANAIRYTESGGVLLACRLVDGGQHVRIDVCDSGPGIDAQHHKAIFAEFFQVGNAARNRSMGLGLGLNIVERTAQLLAHPLALRSCLGFGARFSLTLPCVPVGVKAPALGPEAVQRHGEFEGFKVLVLEDDRMELDAMAALLASWGLRVGDAECLASAMRLLAAGFEPDLIISDYRLLGDANGIESIAFLRAERARLIPACLVSGDADKKLIDQAKAAQLTLLHKPVRPAKLRSLVRHLLAKPPGA